VRRNLNRQCIGRECVIRLEILCKRLAGLATAVLVGVREITGIGLNANSLPPHRKSEADLPADIPRCPNGFVVCGASARLRRIFVPYPSRTNFNMSMANLIAHAIRKILVVRLCGIVTLPIPAVADRLHTSTQNFKNDSKTAE